MKTSKLPYILAVLLALIAGLAVMVYTGQANQRAQNSGETVKALVASGTISSGMTLGEAQASGLVKSQTFPTANVPTDVITTIATGNQDLVAVAPVSAGQLLLGSNFSDTGSSAGALKVPDGMLAVSVNMDDPARVGNFVVPGSEIVIFDTIVTDQKEGTQSTRVLLERVRVLAVGTQVTVSDTSASGKAGSVVTVAVTQKQAEMLVHAQKIGSLYFGLLGKNATVIPDSGVDDTNLTK